MAVLPVTIISFVMSFCATAAVALSGTTLKRVPPFIDFKTSTFLSALLFISFCGSFISMRSMPFSAYTTGNEASGEKLNSGYFLCAV